VRSVALPCGVGSSELGFMAIRTGVDVPDRLLAINRAVFGADLSKDLMMVVFTSFMHTGWGVALVRSLICESFSMTALLAIDVDVW
jgi:hypothetical protein